MNNTERLSNVNIHSPIWKGPESSHRMGGVTQSLLGKFIACPARFKALVIDNLKPRDKFNHRIEYGNMFHVCDEYYVDGGRWKPELDKYCENLIIRYPFDQVEILKWYKVCLVQFPIYINYWAIRETTKNSLLQEEVFHIPYKLPSGRVVYLRGKWDAIELEDGLWVYDTKTKSEIDRENIERRLKYDIQMMTYLISLREAIRINLYPPMDLSKKEIRGIRYNIVRRPLSGNEGDIRQTQKETEDEFFDRLRGVIDGTGIKRTKENYTGPSAWFARWESEVSSEDVEQFEKNTLIPCLERLCNWWDYQNGKPWTQTHQDSVFSTLNYTTPFGIFSQVTEKYETEYDDYIFSGGMNKIGLDTCSNLFPELQEG